MSKSPLKSSLLLTRLMRRSASERAKRKRRVRIEKLEKEFLDPLEAIQEIEPPVKRRRILWTLLILVALTLLWSWFSRIDVVATATGRFIPDGRSKVIQAQELSAVEDIFVDVGDRVEAGQILAQLDESLQLASNEAIKKALNLNKIRQQRLRNSLKGSTPEYNKNDNTANLQEEIWQAEQSRYISQRETSMAAMRDAKAEQRAGKSQLNHLLEQQNISRQRLESSRILADIGAIPRNDYLSLKESNIALESEIETQRQRLDSLSSRVTSAQEALTRLEAERRLELLASLEAVIGESYTLTEQSSHTSHALERRQLHSPVSGTVQTVNVSTDGEIVAAGSSIIEIVPDEAPLLVELQLSDRDAGFVEVGQEVEIKVEAFPFTQYGVLPGNLIWISADAENMNQGSYYRAWVEPQDNQLKHNGEAINVRPGMSVSVDVNTGERRVIDFFIGPIARNFSEGLGVR